MDRRKELLTVLGGGMNPIKSLFGSAITVYYTLEETSGLTAVDRSANNYNGTWQAALATFEPSPLGKSAPYLNGGGTRYVLTTLPISYEALGAEGSFIIQLDPESSMWTDNTSRFLMRLLGSDTSNRIQIIKNTSNLIQIQHIAGGTAKNQNIQPQLAGSAWLVLEVRWSKSENTFSLYLNGSQMTDTVTGLGTAAASASVALHIGTGLVGYAANVILLNRPTTATERAAVVRLLDPDWGDLLVLGDSISVNRDTSQTWPYAIHTAIHSRISNRAGIGHTIASNLAGQVAAATGDTATRIIVHIGTNDDNAGNMATLQAIVEAALVQLAADHPAASLYVMNVLPRWTDTGGGTPVDKSNIRTAIAAACTAQSVTVWDTFTAPWITASQTSDGLHPTTAGQLAIATNILALL